MSALVPTCVWRIRDELITALDERFGDPVDAYVNGSQTWLAENGPGGIVLEWRLHPVPGYERPPALGTYDVFPTVAARIVAGEDPPVPVASLWDGLEAFAAYGEETEPALLRAAVVEALGVEPDAVGLADHQRIGDQWEHSRGAISIIAALLDQLDPPAPAP
jgi:hypothetical protein